MQLPENKMLIPKSLLKKKTKLLCEKSITSNDRIENAKHDFQEA